MPTMPLSSRAIEAHARTTASVYSRDEIVAEIARLKAERIKAVSSTAAWTAGDASASLSDSSTITDQLQIFARALAILDAGGVSRSRSTTLLYSGGFE